MAEKQIMLCGSQVTLGGTTLGKLIDINGLGASRRAVDASYSGADWAEVILSCIARLTPFTATIAFDPNYDWKTQVRAALAELEITWSIPGGYTTAATLSFQAGVTDYTVRGSNEERVIATVVVTPSGEPTITPGTPVP